MRNRDWLIIAVAVAIIAGLILMAARHEGFMTKGKFPALEARVKEVGVHPDMALMAMFAPADDALTITQVDLDSIKAGTWDVEGAVKAQEAVLRQILVEKFGATQGEQLSQLFKESVVRLYRDKSKGPGNKTGAEHLSESFAKIFKIRAEASAPATPPPKTAASALAAVSSAVSSTLSPAAPSVVAAPVSLSSPSPPASTATAGPTPYDPTPAGPGCRSWGGGQWCST